MKAINIIFLFITITVLFTFKTYASHITFKAGDDTLETKLCMAAVTNDLSNAKRYVRILGDQVVGGWSISTSMYHKAKILTDQMRCNDTDLVKFTAQYDADKTFNYFNKRAMKKYRLSTDEVKIIDITRLNNPSTSPQIVVVTSR